MHKVALTEVRVRAAVTQLCAHSSISALDRIEVRNAMQSPAQRAPASFECIREFIRAVHLTKCEDGASASADRVERVYGRCITALPSDATWNCSSVLRV